MRIGRLWSESSSHSRCRYRPVAISSELALTNRAGAGRRSPGRVRRPVAEGIRITRIGLVYILFTLVVGVAATNTGSNSLYLVLATLLSLLVVSGITSRANVRGLAVDLEPPEEIHAGQSFDLTVRVHNTGRFLSRWLLVFWVGERDRARLIPYLSPGSRGRGQLDLEIERRGRHRLGPGHLSSLFPLGLFRKGVRYREVVEVLVLPRLLSDPVSPVAGGGERGERAAPRPGFGHDLRALRDFRTGDDPRGVHWKQTARTGVMIFMEREAEEGRRVSIVCDNAVGPLDRAARHDDFEHLVSAAATAGCHYIERGFAVELVTRDGVLPFATGRRQRMSLLETLALVEARAATREPLWGRDPQAPHLRFILPLNEAMSVVTENAAV